MKIVLALGGNALGSTPKEQLSLVEHTASAIVELLEAGHQVVIGHGNGPQVGMINLAFDAGSNAASNIPDMPFAECGAMSQGYIGYHLQQALQNKLQEKGIQKNVCTLITQVEVDRDDKAFLNPTKPIGSFYTQEQANHIAQTKRFTFVEDSGRGYRRVVPSPLPKDIVEINTIRSLIDQGQVVITVGGGGIPVIVTEHGRKGVDAVIDKDMSCALLAQRLHADMLIILTAVDAVCLHYGKPEQIALSSLTERQAADYIKEGQFGKGSMLPKVQACLQFVKATGNPAVITSLEKARQALDGHTGTRITKS